MHSSCGPAAQHHRCSIAPCCGDVAFTQAIASDHRADHFITPFVTRRMTLARETNGADGQTDRKLRLHGMQLLCEIRSCPGLCIMLIATAVEIAA